MKATWIGEDGAPDFIDAHGFRFYAGKPVDVPEEVGIGKLMGNPFFTLDATKAEELPPPPPKDDRGKGGGK